MVSEVQQQQNSCHACSAQGRRFEPFNDPFAIVDCQ
jgi:hypothetical protein